MVNGFVNIIFVNINTRYAVLFISQYINKEQKDL